MAKSLTTALPNLESRILGTIYGNCIGDAIGLLTEFMVKKEASKYYGNHIKEGLEYEHKVPDFHRSRWKNGDWTDDSDQMLLIMDSLQEKDGVDPIDFGQRLIGWARHGFPELGDFGGMGIGATTHYVLHHRLFNTDPHAAAEEIWQKSDRQAAPNGGVMRTSILGIYQFGDTETKVVENCLQLCKVTHADPRCQASCIAVCCAISLMLQQKHFSKGKFDITKLIDSCFEQAKKVLPNKKAEIKELHAYMYVKNLKDLKLEEHGKIGYTYKCLGAGFWALKQSNFRKALTDITMEAGDADTNGAVAGALLGCKLGHSELPPTWLNTLYHKQWLDNKICRFLEKFVPEVSPITLVKYKELEKDPDAQRRHSGKPIESAGENDERSEAKKQKSDDTINHSSMAANIPGTGDLPYADEEDGDLEVKVGEKHNDGQGQNSRSSAEKETEPIEEVEEINKVS